MLLFFDSLCAGPTIKIERKMKSFNNGRPIAIYEYISTFRWRFQIGKCAYSYYIIIYTPPFPSVFFLYLFCSCAPDFQETIFFARPPFFLQPFTILYIFLLFLPDQPDQITFKFIDRPRLVRGVNKENPLWTLPFRFLSFPKDFSLSKRTSTRANANSILIQTQRG